jgi:hypothetical protein
MKNRKNIVDRFFVKYFNNQILSEEFINSIDDTIYNDIDLQLMKYKNVENSIDFNQYCYMLYNKIKTQIK